MKVDFNIKEDLLSCVETLIYRLIAYLTKIFVISQIFMWKYHIYKYLKMEITVFNPFKNKKIRFKNNIATH